MVNGNDSFEYDYGLCADPANEMCRFIPNDILADYEVYSYKHAAAILYNSYPNELEEIVEALRKFRISIDDITTPGGNESPIPKKISGLLRPKAWFETKISGDLLITLEVKEEKWKEKSVIKEVKFKRESYIDGHKIDYVKNGVAFDLEWNSKDQTFDRDLYAFRAFFECGVIGCGIILTRSQSLNAIFSKLKIKDKYGASTTWLGKLLYRLKAGRNGGCPVLALGITPKVIEGLES